MSNLSADVSLVSEVSADLALIEQTFFEKTKDVLPAEVSDALVRIDERHQALEFVVSQARALDPSEPLAATVERLGQLQSAVDSLPDATK